MTIHDDAIIRQFTRWAKPFADLPIHAEADGMARSVAACALSGTEELLDVACGPGILTCALAGEARAVAGIDVTAAMIEQARAREAAMGLGNLDWHVGNAAALPFADNRFDRVVTRYSFHHMTDPVAILAEMRRVCRPGGRIVVIDATPSPETQAAYDRMETLRDPTHTSALTLDQLRVLGREAGLCEVLVDSYLLEARLDTLTDAQDMPALTAMFDADIASGQDAIGVGAWHAPDGVRFRFPISIIAWEKP
ncbi:MAG TPA: class I SAM-dependent methyltransferase [Novosphingobium sp.]|nr:class I SAM-dependent methyltransferase [Novosphingobium sp.]